MSRRILIIGSPGAGKSTFSRRLAAQTGLPLHHLDAIYWRSDRTHLTREELVAQLMPVLESSSWIIDGNYNGTLPLRLRYCTEVILLDYPLDVCIAGIHSRTGQIRSDMPWVEDKVDEDFLAFVKAFPEQIRPQIHALMAQYPEIPFTVLTARADAEHYLNALKP